MAVIEDRAFELAYFWRLDPCVILSLPLSSFELYERQAMRLADHMRPDDG